MMAKKINPNKNLMKVALHPNLTKSNSNSSNQANMTLGMVVIRKVTLMLTLIGRKVMGWEVAVTRVVTI